MRPSKTTLVGVFLLAFSVRLAWILGVQHPCRAVYSDMGGYVDRAEQLLWHLPTPDPRVLDIYPWGTHALYALEFAVLGRHGDLRIAIAHALLGAIPAPCAALLTARLVPSRAVAGLSGGLVALWFPQVAFSAFFLSEPWFAAAIALQAVFTASPTRRPLALLGTGVASGIAFVVRPQFVVTWAADLVRAGIAKLRSGGVRRAVGTVSLLAFPLVALAAGSAVRLHALSGHWGLISENDELTRIWADTEICQLKSHWTLPSGARLQYWFNPPSKPATKPSDIEEFEGFIADPNILKRIRLQRLQGVPVTVRLARKLHNVGLLFTSNLPWPESNYRDPPWRRALLVGYANALLFVVLPLAAVGVLLGRRNAAHFIASANAVTCIVCAAFFFGEARYHVPYDPFFLVLAVAGTYELARRRFWFATGRRRRGIAAAPVP